MNDANVDYECLVCLLNHSNELMNQVKNTSQEAPKELFNGYKNMILQTFEKIDYSQTHYELKKTFYDVFSEIFGEEDYFHNHKTDLNQRFLEIYEDLLDFCFSYQDPLYAANKLSIMGEILCQNSNNFFGELEIQIKSFFNSKKIILYDIEELKKELEKSRFLLFIHNYAGEIVFDKVFIRVIKEFYPDIIIHSALKSKPIYICATKKDAEEIFLKEVSIPFESGSKYLGTSLNDTFSSFQNIYNEADLVIAKGQSNFQSLMNENGKKPVYFSFVTKCQKVSSFLNVNRGDLVFKKFE